MMKKWGIWVLCGICVIVLTVVMLFRTSTRIEAIPVSQVKLDKEIKWSAGVAQIDKKFKKIQDLITVETGIVFVGMDKNQTNVYKFNPTEGSFFLMNELSKVGFEPKSQSLIACLYGDYTLFMDKKENVLFTYQEHKKITIGSPLINEKTGLPYFQKSEDGKRFIFISADGKNVIAYHLEKKRRKVIGLKDQVVMTANDVLDLALSADGEYFSINKYDLSKPKEAKLSVIGTDTGKYYANGVIGISSKWSPVLPRMAFLFTGELKSNEIDLVRVGVLDIRNRKITYYDQGKTNGLLSETLDWTQSGESLCYLGYNKHSDGSVKTQLSVFDVTSLTKKNYHIDAEIKTRTPRFFSQGRQVGFECDDTDVVYLVDTESQMVKSYHGLDDFYIEDLNHRQRILQLNDALIGLDEDVFMTLTVFGTQQVWDPTPLNTHSMTIPKSGNYRVYVEKNGVSDEKLVVQKRLK